jgi:tripartite-type tricarboxylate transporter receptor subunit TctC
MAWADTAYPLRPIRLVVPFPPGGSPDVLARTLGQKLSEASGVPVIVENIAGAGGTLGAERVAKAAPDGYTLLMGHIGTLAFAPAIYPQLPYDPVRSFTPVSAVARVPNVLAIYPGLPAKNLAEWVDYLRRNPGSVNYGSGGNGSAAHLAVEYFKLSTRTFIVHVPYRGTAPSVTDAVAGQVQMVFTGAPAIVPMVKAGKLRALAVTGTRRLDALPDVPTFAETGVKGLNPFEADQWYGVVAPAGVPRDVVVRLNQWIQGSLNAPEVRERLAAEGATLITGDAASFGQFIQKEIARWRPVVANANIKPG